MKLQVNSEIGRLKKVLLHRPGRELDNLTPDLLERLLFDDIPWLATAQKEHDEFAAILKDNGVEVYYLEQMVAEAIENKEAYDEFLEKFISEAIETNEFISEKANGKEILRKHLEKISDKKELVDLTIAGIRCTEVGNDARNIVSDDYFFIADPLPNLYFQRDPYASIGNGHSINTMFSITRNRETLYAYIMFKYHPDFKGENIPEWFGRYKDAHIEGGDQLVINKNNLLIGNSQRTSFEGIKKIAKNILLDDGNSFERIVSFNIGQTRKFMHLDTVFTMIDYNKFSVHPEAVNMEMDVNVITVEGDELKIEEITGKGLKEILGMITGRDDIQLIECGDGDPIAASREQWSDGANTLAIAPGEVVVYSRNEVTNAAMEREGIKLHIMSSAELSRGRGGPRCMSMPLEREEI